MADIYGDVDEDNFERMDEMYEAVDDANVTEAYWYHGEIDRKVTEKLITQDSLPGNFLVRKKGGTKTFVHSYLSMSQNKVVHNLMEFQRDPSGSQTLMVDQREFSTTSLDDAVNKIQSRLKQWRKFKETPDPSIAQQVQMNWGSIFQPTIEKDGAWQFLRGQKPGSFVVRNGTQGLALTTMKAGAQSAAEMHHLTIVQHQVGAYIKFSELIGHDVQTLVGVILTNPDRATATGIPHDLVIPQAAQRPPPGGGGRGGPVGYDEAAGDDDGEYGALDDGNPDDTYEEFDDDDERASGGGGGGRRAVPPPAPADDDDDDYGAIDHAAPPGGGDEDEYGEVDAPPLPLPQDTGNAHDDYDDAEGSDGDYGPAVPPGRPPPMERRAVPPPADDEDAYNDEDYGPSDDGPPPRPPPIGPGADGGDDTYNDEDYGPSDDGPPPRPPPIRGGYEEDYDEYDDAEGNDGAPPPPMPPRPPKN